MVCRIHISTISIHPNIPAKSLHFCTQLTSSPFCRVTRAAPWCVWRTTTWPWSASSAGAWAAGGRTSRVCTPRWLTTWTGFETTHTHDQGHPVSPYVTETPLLPPLKTHRGRAFFTQRKWGEGVVSQVLFHFGSFQGLRAELYCQTGRWINASPSWKTTPQGGSPLPPLCIRVSLERGPQRWKHVSVGKDNSSLRERRVRRILLEIECLFIVPRKPSRNLLPRDGLAGQTTFLDSSP